MADPFERAFTCAPIPIALVDVDGRLQHVNLALCGLLSYPPDECRSRTLHDFVDPHDSPIDLADVERTLLSQTSSRCEIERRFVDAHGRTIPVVLDMALVPSAPGEPRFLEVLVQSASGRQMHDGAIDDLIDRDPLTNLFNRRRFETLLAVSARTAQRYGGGAVLVLDLDHFKEVNDRFGHRAGDDLLIAAAATLRSRVRESDLLARLGGDEFAVIVGRVDRAQAEVVADELVKALRRQVVTLGQEHIRVTASIGVAMFDTCGKVDPLAAADLAMYDAKAAGRDRYAVYGSMNAATASARMEEISRIQGALDDGRLELYCQPIVELANDHVGEYELLVRLRTVDGGVAAPGDFLHVAERLGTIAAIDAWVVQRATRVIADHAARGDALTLNVNVSARSLGDPTLMTSIDRSLTDSHIDPACLVFEVSEPGAVGNIERTRAFIDAVRGRGCRLALDDFGTGVGSLYCLKLLPFDYLKIDGDLIASSTATRADHLIIDAIVGIARTMGKQTVAEFVTSQPVMDRLRNSGVDFAQGFHVGPPRPLAEVL